MKKILLPIITLIIVASIAATMFLGNIVKTGIETAGPDILGSDVKIKDVNISLLSGNMEINDLVVKNPEGFEKGDIFSLGKVIVKIDVSSIFNETILIKNIQIANPKISYQIQSGTTNLKELINNIEKNEASSSTNNLQTTEGAPKPSASKHKNIVIKDLKIINATVNASINGAQASLPQLNLHLKDIGKDGEAIPLSQATSFIVNNVVKEIAKVNLGSLIKGINSGEASEKAKKLLEGLDEKVKGLFGN